jgi:hypothetical protein
LIGGVLATYHGAGLKSYSTTPILDPAPLQILKDTVIASGEHGDRWLFIFKNGHLFLPLDSFAVTFFAPSDKPQAQIIHAHPKVFNPYVPLPKDASSGNRLQRRFEVFTGIASPGDSIGFVVITTVGDDLRAEISPQFVKSSDLRAAFIWKVVDWLSPNLMLVCLFLISAAIGILICLPVLRFFLDKRRKRDLQSLPKL